jgi:hypothetical protein
VIHQDGILAPHDKREQTNMTGTSLLHLQINLAKTMPILNKLHSKSFKLLLGIIDVFILFTIIFQGSEKSMVK